MPRVLIIDHDPKNRRLVKKILVDAGLTCDTSAGGTAALRAISQQPPCLVLTQLAMPIVDGYAILEHVRSHAQTSHVPVVVLSDTESEKEIQRIFESGADDCVHVPFRRAELVARIYGQLRTREYVERLSRKEHDQQTVIELTQALASSLDIRDILFTVVKRVAEVARVDRCSIVLTGDNSKVGYVVATSDDEKLRDLPIALSKYPEIQRVIGTGQPLVIQDARNHPLLEVVRQTEPGITFKSIALMPIMHDQGSMGVIFLRSRHDATYSEHELSLVHTVANATAIALRNAQILQSLRDETQQSAFARVEAESRVRLFQRYADFFESAAEGTVVIDREGRILFANTRTREITGYSETELIGMSLQSLVNESDRERAQRLLRGFSQGIYPRGVDAQFTTKAGEPIVMSLSFSSVLHEDNAILMNFRDVTRERKTAVELKQTKEFLERVIDSSVDAIVVGDLRGDVLLFNRAAARIFGYEPHDVIGRRALEKLYPPGVARDVMRKIRGPEFGGSGRLEDFRVDMLSAKGEKIPVMLSAALVMDKDEPIGSIGVFTDIRDKLQMEARLERAQEELQSRQKQAIVAELAGAAAHELNQPLTSVIGYAELLRRRLSESQELANAASVIITESERMAEIVRKVGRITRYETKSYVGGAKILDLEKASGSTPPSVDTTTVGDR